MSRKDIDLRSETMGVLKQFPFAHHKSEAEPVSSRVRSTLRSIEDFDNVQKLNRPSPDEILIIKASENPYELNRNLRKKTKN